MSGALPASLVPMMVMMLDKASLRLLTASVMIAMEFDIKPTRALKATSIRFAMILMILVLMTVCSRFLLICIIVS